MALTRERMSKTDAFFLLSFTGICDVLQLGLKLLWFFSVIIPPIALVEIVLSKALGIIGWLTVIFVLSLHSIYPLRSSSGPQDLALLGVAGIIELFPGTDAIPCLTLWTFYKIRESWKTDRAKLKQQREERAAEAKRELMARQAERALYDRAA